MNLTVTVNFIINRSKKYIYANFDPINKLILMQNQGIIQQKLKNYSFSEISELLKTNRPLDKEFEEREFSTFLISEGGIKEYNKEEAKKIQSFIIKPLEKLTSIKGSVACSGKTIGVAFIVKLQDNLLSKMREISKIKDPILIAEQTVPAYLPLIEKSKGIVTNEGGVLSHAAIVSREFNIPCITGTEKATEVFKDGDLVELDANKGIVRKLN